MATQLASMALATDDTLKRIAVCLENNGTLSELHTTDKTSLVAAINELDGDIGDLSTLTTTAKDSAVAAINEVDAHADAATVAAAKAEVLIITLSSVTELPQTVNNAAIESDMVCIHAEYSSSSAYVNATVTTSNGSLTVTGSISGTTNITLYLMKSRTN